MFSDKVRALNVFAVDMMSTMCSFKVSLEETNWGQCHSVMGSHHAVETFIHREGHPKVIVVVVAVPVAEAVLVVVAAVLVVVAAVS